MNEHPTSRAASSRTAKAGYVGTEKHPIDGLLPWIKEPTLTTIATSTTGYHSCSAYTSFISSEQRQCEFLCVNPLLFVMMTGIPSQGEA